MSLNNFVKRIQVIMRKDPGVDGDAQRISQLVWLIFLFVYDAREEIWEDEAEDNGKEFVSIIPEGLRWRNWAIDNKDGEALTGDDLIKFIDEEVFPTLSQLEITERTPQKQAIVRYAIEGLFNYMKDGVLLREIINIINEINIHDYSESHAFNDIYETILKDLQSAGNAGEFYTPRPLTSFIVSKVDPKIGERVGDMACGTGGFLIDSYNHMYKPGISPEEHELIGHNLVGVEKKPLPHMLCTTNMILHGIDEPNITHGNSLNKNIREYNENEKFDCIVMNPPFGGIEKEAVRMNFPTDMRTSETADLFVATILYRLRQNGRVGIVLPDGFLFGNDNAKVAIKKKLLETCNLHTIVRLPNGVFSPYTSLSVNVLFFDKGENTQKIDYYQVPLAEGLKNGFTKTKPFTKKHLDSVNAWWENRTEEDENAYSVTLEEVVKRGYNLDIKNPNIDNGDHIYTLPELLADLEHRSENIQILSDKLVEAFEGVLD